MPIHVAPISRRRFLAGTLATGAGLLLPRSVRAADEAADPNHWILMSDTHVWGDRDRVQNGTKSAANFIETVRQISTLSARPAGAIVSGDVAAIEGTKDDYATLAEEVVPLRKAGVPIHFALGNHDHRANFHAAFPDTVPEGKLSVPDKHVSIIETPHANWFLLDSLEKTNVTPGLLGEAQLAWLGKALDARADKPALIVAHHNPDKSGRGSGLRDSNAMFELLAGRRHVKAYVFGHSHRWQLTRHDDMHLINLPTTAWLFDKKQPRAWIDAVLRADGLALTVHALDGKHPKHDETVDLAWRA